MVVTTKVATRTAVLERLEQRQDCYAKAFGHARQYLEEWMRGRPLNVDAFVAALGPLPDTVCKTLIHGLPPDTAAEVQRRLTLFRGDKAQ